MAIITRIRVPASYWEPDNSLLGRQVNKVADFTLGVGPCGKNVIEIDITMLPCGGVAVGQICSDSEAKEFYYPAHTLTGRVEVTHG